GIGKLMAQRLMEEGAARVILWDINLENLTKTKAEFEQRGFETHTYLVDVGDLQDITLNASRVQEEVGDVDILINNAGIVVGKPFVEHTHRDIKKTIDINVSGVMHVTLAFLPRMVERKKGHIVNIASAAGLIANPNMSVYAGSKWAVVGWSDSLRLEMEEKCPSIKVLTVMPSYINTGMFEGVKAPLLTPIMEPEYIVGKIIAAIKSDEIMLQEPFMVKMIPFLKGILPQFAFDLLAGNIFGVYKTMETFKGRPSHEAVPEKTVR
ncbi:MAG: SDR family oxidoreductase, partial [Flammeovirgaceae bacterium]|nr:SDR family oxidoreductase [Flammeovirgaceae bacterium]